MATRTRQKMMKKLGYVSSLLVMTLLVACGQETKETKPKKDHKAKTHQTTKSKKAASDTTGKKTESSSGKSSAQEVAIDLAASQRVGSENFGFVNIPKDWVSFHDVDGKGETLQYSDLTGVNIITLDHVTAERRKVDDLSKYTLEDIGGAYAQTLESTGQTTKLWGAKTKVADYDALQINAFTKTDGIITCWVFKASNNEIYYIALEGDKETFTKVLPYIEQTWSLNK
ncbi:hypothetical protein [Streptococcus iniae]|uniref:hypothetical protein n=1 Tax=Streptococcus iniae TaxID=1346 RepID=UPI0002D8934B|nr:hypothetical protein [Streptococcus iniae]